MKKVYVLFCLIFCTTSIFSQVTVFTDAFTASTGATYTTPSGAIGTSTTWSLTSSGADWGARIDGGILDVTNDASATANVAGWAFASTPTTSFISPYNSTLNLNGGVVTWTFNIRVNRANLAGFNAGGYGLGFILAGSSTAANNTGTGYALVLGNSGAVDPFKLVKYTAGMASLGTAAVGIITSNTAGFTNIATNYYSVKVTYTPSTDTWELFLRDDGTTAFADPAVGSLTSQGTAVDNTYTGTSLGFLGGYWQGSTTAAQLAYYDNVKVTVPAAGTPTVNVTPTSLSGFSALSGVPTAEQTYAVDGSNLTNDIIITPPVGYEIATVTGGPYTANPASITLTQSGGVVASTTIYVRMNSATLGVNAGNITNTSTGSNDPNVALTGNVLDVEPTVQSAITFGAITNSTMVVNFSGGNGASRILVARAVTPVNSDPVDGTTYTGNSIFGLGTQLGVGNYAVYVGTGNTQLVSGLAAGTTYQFAVYEFNDGGGTAGAENYLVPGGTGSAMTIDVPVIYTWIGGSSTWTTAANWAPTRLFPATNDILLFLDGTTETVTAVPNQSIGQLHVTLGTKVTLQAAVTTTALTINGSIALDDLTVDGTSALNIDGANGYSINLATGTTGVIDGAMSFTGGAHRLTAADASGITFNSGAVFTDGLAATGTPFGAGTANSVVFGNGSTFIQGGGSNPFSIAQPNSIVVFQTGSLFKLIANLTPSVSGRTYANFELDAPTFSINATGAALLTMDNLTVTNGTLNSGMTTAGFNLKGNIAVAAGATLNLAPSTSGTLNFVGTTPQTINNLGTLNFTSTQNVNINNSNGVTLNAPVSFAGVVTFTSGLVNSDPVNLLTFANGSSVTGASNASFVNGPVAKIGNSNFTFPVGKINTGYAANKNGYAAISISNSVGGFSTDQYTAEYFRGNANSMGAKTLGLDHVSACDYWVLDQDAGASTLDVKLTWQDSINNCSSTSPYVDNLPALVVAHYDGATWDNFGAPGTALGTAASGDVTWPGVSVFSPFAIGSIDFTNPLPITINYFTGAKQNGNHLLNWKVTCVSTPSATIEIERSTDGRNYSSIYSIVATALRCNQPFDYTDNNPAKGTNYYRLKMTSVDGKLTYSSIVTLINATKGIDVMNIAPNPIVNGSFNVKISSAAQTQMELVITDMQGRVLQKQAVSMIAGFNTIPMNVRNLAAGTYQLFGHSDDGRTRVVRFVIQ